MDNLEKNIGRKELLPEQYAILIEKDVIEKYSPLLIKQNASLSSPTEIKQEWIKLYADKYRRFFNQHGDELISLYKQSPEAARDFVEKGLEEIG